MVENLSSYQFTKYIKNTDINKDYQLYCCICKQPIILCINGPAYGFFDDDCVTCSHCMNSYEETTRAECLNSFIENTVPNWQEPMVQDTTNRVLVRLERCD